ncbi:uncharacterized protein SPSK_07271 [Sporothrix schenckii 1099-18]|uniref:Uncharacterized protein n=1 Tax=Sporothrix schenckii 1099-18 TaxID=1397361 RepID=A0A0F2MFH5_SPOSC|nr:uncharacterized protein SPSK_07271 [Sporothrix schenckii 1099-18]KJR87829.1 hypothetical protein SPSK_07271 [Sporothrix schenckii 1099-18]
MAPPLQWTNGPLVKTTELTNASQARSHTIKRFEDPNDQDCHGWSCYTSAEQAGIIFMSIIVPIVLFMVFWYAVMRPILDNMSISDYDDLEPQQPPPPTQPVQPPPPEIQPQAPIQEQQPKEAPAPPPEQPAQPPPPPPAPGPSSPPQKEQSPVQSPLKLPPITAVENTSSPGQATQSPTVVLNFNGPQIGSPFLACAVSPEAPAKAQPQPKPANQPIQKHAEQQEPQLAQQEEVPVVGNPAGVNTGEPSGQKFEQQHVHQPPSPQAPQGGSQIPFAPNQSFPPGQPFPPGVPCQQQSQPVYFTASQFMPILPPPPPPLHGQAPPAVFTGGTPIFPGPPGLYPSNHIPQMTSYGPPAAPPGFQVPPHQMATRAFRGQPDSPTTLNTSCSTGQQSMLSRAHRHPPPGRARTISDPLSDRVLSDSLLKASSLSEITLPSETSVGRGNGHKKSKRRGYRRDGRRPAAKPSKTETQVRRDTLRLPKDTYQRRPDGRYRRDVKDITVRRTRRRRNGEDIPRMENILAISTVPTDGTGIAPELRQSGKDDKP